MKKNKILVIGGGAAGLMAAIMAARRGLEVIILERMSRVGKKILATGNGRCNLTNVYAGVGMYHGKNPEFIVEAFNQFTVKNTIDFFKELGIECKEEEGGKVYPWSDQASSVLDVLRYECERLGVVEKYDAEVKKIEPFRQGFKITLKEGEDIIGDKVIVTAGGKASPNLGSNGSGYSLLTSIGHKLVEPFPALVQLRLDSPSLKAVNGVKFTGRAAVGIEDRVLREESGEILFTSYGISGPPILQLSRSASGQLLKNKKPWIKVDMFPEISDEELEMGLWERIAAAPHKTLEFSFVGLLNKRLIPVVLKEAGVSSLQKPCIQTSSKEMKEIIGVLKHWKFYITGTQSWTEAQVTAGGIDVKDVNPNTMESKIVPGLYIAGEILDIDGDCGGFNLQWAWSSGFAAGQNV